MEITLSIALVTRNRPESLEQTLVSLSKQQPQPFEVLVSDDSDNLDSIRANKEIALRYNCKYLSGPQNGLYANRNFVASHCSGSHIRTMDDDHEFPENHLQECIKAIQQDNKAIWTIGEYFVSITDRPVPAPVPGQLHPRGYSFPPPRMDEYYGISCGASIYPRSVVDNNILNVDLYKFGILYLEYGIRLLNEGYSIKYLDSTYVIHHEHPANDSIITMKSKSALEIIDGARVFCMLMFSFHHKKTLYNKASTSVQIVKDLIMGNYSRKTVITAIRNFKMESKKQKLGKSAV